VTPDKNVLSCDETLYIQITQKRERLGEFKLMPRIFISYSWLSIRITIVNKEAYKKFLGQNLIECFLGNAPTLRKNSSKSVHNFSSNLADKQTDKGKNITYFLWEKQYIYSL